MSVKVASVCFHESYIQVVLEGASASLARQYELVHETIFAATFQYSCANILLDASHISYVPDVSLEHQTALDLAEKSARHPFLVRIALVSPPQAKTANLHLEMAARNRSANIQVFWEIEKALDWLIHQGKPGRIRSTS